jgi:hypothetical protein
MSETEDEYRRESKVSRRIFGWKIKKRRVRQMEKT